MLPMENEFLQPIENPFDTIKVISGRILVFVYLYILFCFFFAFSFTLMMIAAIATCLSFVFGHDRTGDIYTYIKIIGSFDFDNPAFKNTNEWNLTHYQYCGIIHQDS